jgi:hypothetical protein
MAGTMAGDSWLAREAGRNEPNGYLSENLTCRRCGDPLPVQLYRGNARVWCSERCRQAAWRAARRAANSAAS